MSNNVFRGNYDLNCFEIKFNKYKVSTCYYEKPFICPMGCNAQIITKVVDNQIEYKIIATGGQVVPACTPCYLESDEAKTYQFWFDETNTDKAPEPNYLWGTTTSIHAFEKFPQDKYKIYKLTLNNDETKAGWYMFDPSYDMLKPNKAIFVIPLTK